MLIEQQDQYESQCTPNTALTFIELENIVKILDCLLGVCLFSAGDVNPSTEGVATTARYGVN